jgi:hypothetical protein
MSDSYQHPDGPPFRGILWAGLITCVGLALLTWAPWC